MNWYYELLVLQRIIHSFIHSLWGHSLFTLTNSWIGDAAKPTDIGLPQLHSEPH